MAIHWEHLHNNPELERVEGNPIGTYFVVAILGVLLMLVSVYFLSTHVREVQTSPVLQQAVPAEYPALSR